MRELIFNIFLDMHAHTSQAVIRVKKGDTKNRIIVHLLEFAKPYVITERSYAIFAAKKPDGNGIVNDCEIIDNTIQYTLSGQSTACVGTVACEFRLYDEDGNLLSTPRFTVLVDDTLFSDIEDNIESTYEVGTLDRLIIEGTELIEEAEAVIKEANEASDKVNKYLKLTDLDKVVGASAYEIAVSNGYEGTEEEWLESLAAENGASAYEVAVKNGFEGTEQEWLESLGKDEKLIRNGEAENSIEIGETAEALTPSSVAIGTDNIAGVCGYYIIAIDTTNKYIYLAEKKEADPVITTGDEYYDETFETPAYDASSGNAVYFTGTSSIVDFCIKNEYDYENGTDSYPGLVEVDATLYLSPDGSGMGLLQSNSDEDFEFDAIRLMVEGHKHQSLWFINSTTTKVVYCDEFTDHQYTVTIPTSRPLVCSDISSDIAIAFKYTFPDLSFEEGFTTADEFCIINGKHYAFCGEIASVDHNKITYSSALPFSNIVASGDSSRDFLEDHIFYVPSKADIGSVDSVFTNAVVIGTDNIAAGANGLVSGFGNILGGNHGFIVGRNNKGGYACIVGGTDNDSSGVTSTTFGRDHINKGWCCYVEGRSNTMPAPTQLREDGYPENNMYNHLEGHSNEVDGGNLNHLEGQKNKSTGNYGHVENFKNTDNGKMNHTEGTENTNNGEVCHVGGWKNTDNGKHNYTTGYNNTNNGERGIVGGYSNTVEQGEQANAYGNAVFGARNKVKGALHMTTGSDHEIDSAGRVFTWGRGNISKAPVQQVGGQYNEQNDSALMIIGNGTSATKRSNAFEVYKTHIKARAVTDNESCVRNILLGTSVPDDSEGNDGDIYIMYEE